MAGFHHAYLHGFASGPESLKGRFLAQRLAEHGLALHLPDLNIPSFSELTCTGALAAVDRLVAGEGTDGRPWRLIGSSLGGYLAARWAELHPRAVDRLVLLCPGFNLASRWPVLLGPEKMREWEATGWVALPDAQGRPTPVHWGFYRDSLAHPALPEVPCPTLILHGRRDEVVPVESSRRYARTRSHVRLVELDDDHGLVASSERIARETLAFCDATPGR